MNEKTKVILSLIIYTIMFFLFTLISDNTTKFILLAVLNIAVVSILMKVIFTDNNNKKTKNI